MMRAGPFLFGGESQADWRDLYFVSTGTEGVWTTGAMPSILNCSAWVKDGCILPIHHSLLGNDLRSSVTRQLDFCWMILSQCVALLTANRAEVAQLVEHSPEKAGVDSSILSLGTIFPLLARF